MGSKPEPIMEIKAEEWSKVHAQLLDDAVAHPEKYHRRGERLDGNPIALGPRVAPPEEWTAEMINGARNNSAKWLRRVTNPSRNPITAAINSSEKWKAGMQEAIAKDKFKKGLSQADPDMMIDTLVKVGESAYVNGIAAREGKIRKKITKLQALVSAHVAAMDALPDTTAAQRRDKMLKNLDGMIAVGDKMKGG